MIKKKDIICALTIFQIIILMNAIVAQPYLISQSENSDFDKSISKNINNITKQTIILLTSILVIKQIGTVSATTQEGCCQELTNGAICEDVLVTESQKCKTSLLQTECSQVDSCKRGCCVSIIGGVCTAKTIKGKCEAEGGKWNSEVDCGISECQKGCCILGGSTQFVNEKTCEILSTSYGFKKEFKDINSEAQCLALSASQNMGACLYAGGGCSFKTEKECIQNSGTFYKDYLCSEPSLETSCTKQSSIGCADEKDEIYWFDSCGNRENIYSLDRNFSWNNGKVLTKAQSCNPLLSNVNSTTCGNCNRARSSVCSNSSNPKVEDGNFLCKSLECLDGNGNVRQNGESWCVYDSYIGDGKDTVGSEHWRAFCNKGKVEMDMCADYRGRICVQTIMESEGGNLSKSECVANTASICLSYNGEKETMAENCNKNEYCFMKNVNVAELFSFSTCVPKYPKGFDKDRTDENKEICGLASMTCNELWVKDWEWPNPSFHWDCVRNCECKTSSFSNQMNDLCISLGDCGNYINYEGNGTDNTRVSGAPPAKNWTNYKNFSTPVYRQWASKGDDPERETLTYGKKWSLENYLNTRGGNLGTLFLGHFFGVYLILANFLGYGETELRPVTFTCLPWTAPLGGEECTKCQDDPMKPCTNYRCESLGQACVLLNSESETPNCQSIPKENIVPIISPGEPGEGYKFKNITKNGLKFVGNNTECINEFTPVSFTLKTNEYAQCIYSTTLPPSKVFQDMGEYNYPNESNAFTINHTFGIFMPSLNSLSVYDLKGDLKEKFGNMSMYVRCRDYWGNYNIDEYIINFCIHSGPDLSPVNHLYTTTIPSKGTKLKFGKIETNVSLYINEPAECKYSASPEQTYDQMESSMSCETDVRRVTDFGWRCNMSMTTDKEENKIYVKCKDQPWFAGTINETNRNINQDDYEYVLYSSKTELNITSTSPKGTVENGFEPISVNLEVRTSGGAEDGKATCYWGDNLNIPFWETSSNIHKQTLSTLMDGTYSVPVKCEDIAGNIATSEIKFIAKLDTSPPLATRAYKEGGSLVVFTDEEAECYYDLTTCDFDIDNNATSMTTALSTSHRASWIEGQTYYIKCKDVWGNTNPWCAMRVNAG